MTATHDEHSAVPNDKSDTHMNDSGTHTQGRLTIEKQPSWSPHRMFLWREDGGVVYWLQEQKTGARRGASVQWLGFDERDADIMRRVAACWNACEGIATEALERGGFQSRSELIRGQVNGPRPSPR